MDYVFGRNESLKSSYKRSSVSLWSRHAHLTLKDSNIQLLEKSSEKALKHFQVIDSVLRK